MCNGGQLLRLRDALAFSRKLSLRSNTLFLVLPPIVKHRIAYPHLNRPAGSMLKYMLYLIPPEPELAVQETRAHERCYRTAKFRENGRGDGCLVNVPVVNRERHCPTRLRSLARKTIEKVYQSYKLIVVLDQIGQCTAQVRHIAPGYSAPRILKAMQHEYGRTIALDIS